MHEALSDIHCHVHARAIGVDRNGIQQPRFDAHLLIGIGEVECARGTFDVALLIALARAQADKSFHHIGRNLLPATFARDGLHDHGADCDERARAHREFHHGRAARGVSRVTGHHIGRQQHLSERISHIGQASPQRVTCLFEQILIEGLTTRDWQTASETIPLGDLVDTHHAQRIDRRHATFADHEAQVHRARVALHRRVDLHIRKAAATIVDHETRPIDRNQRGIAAASHTEYAADQRQPSRHIARSERDHTRQLTIAEGTIARERE